MKIHTVSFQPGNRNEHLEAIFRHLPAEIQGNHYGGNQMLKPKMGVAPDDIVLAADFISIGKAPNNRVVYVEHGAGQNYASYNVEQARFYYHPRPGEANPHPANVVGYIGPRQDVIDAWGRPGFAAGCPVADDFELYGDDNVCAFTWHWNAHRVAPEATSALWHYHDRMADIVAALRDRGWTVLGARHPQFKNRLSLWRNLGVEEATISDVRRRASLLFADNTSVLYEMLYLGRRVVCLNAPWYRRDVEHGLRFWSHVPGPMVDGPDELLELIPSLDADRSLNWDPTVCEYVYGKALSDGGDGLRAAVWLSTFAAGL